MSARKVHLESPEPGNLLRDFTVGPPVCGLPLVWKRRDTWRRELVTRLTEQPRKVTCKRCLARRKP